MPNKKHIIRKAVVEVYLPHKADASLAQQKALALFREKLLPMIEQILERMGLQREVLRIDKLDLELRGFDPQDTSDATLHRFGLQVEEKLLKLLSEERQNNFAGDIITDVRKIPQERAELELLLHLLRTGTLPWWAKTEEPVVLKRLVQQVFGHSAASLAPELFAILPDAEVRKRIAFNLFPAQVEKIISLLLPSAPQLLKHMDALVRFAGMQAYDSSATETFRALLYKHALLLIRRNEAAENLSLQSFLESFIAAQHDLALAEKLYMQSRLQASDEISFIVKSALAAADAVYAGRIKKMFTVSDRKFFFSKAVMLKKEYMQEPGQDQDEEEASPGSANKKNKKGVSSRPAQDQEEEALPASVNKKTQAGKKEEAGQEQAKAAAAAAKAANKKRRSAEEAGKQEEELRKKRMQEMDPAQLFSEQENGDHFIRNAGMVIIAPYLPPLFKELGLYDGNAFVSEEAQERAVYLTQFLATGTATMPEEHELVLNKILCGVELYRPVIMPFRISEKEREECLNLLQAVADNWPALRGTSGTGMRDAFFRRDGILEQQSNGWNLNIEKTTIDILLDRLPWGISVIGMPWSRKLIFVRW